MPDVNNSSLFTYLNTMHYVTSLLAPFLAVTILNPIPQPVKAVPQVPAGLEYIISSDKDEMFFGKVVARSGNISYVKMFSIEEDGTEHKWVESYNCADETYEAGEGDWEAIMPNTIATYVLKAACSGPAVTNTTLA